MKNRPHILLTGASDAMGGEVLRQLFKQGDDFAVTLFDKKSKASVKSLSPSQTMFEIVHGDLCINEEVQKVCADKDYVIHLATIIPPLADQRPTLAYNVNVMGTENLVRNLEQFSPNASLIYSSSISVYGDRLDNPSIRVDNPLNPGKEDQYAFTKIKAEQIIRCSRLDWTIFRLCALMGKHKISPLMFHMPLSTSLEIATSQDVSRGFIQAMKHRQEISNRIFNLGGGQSCRTTYQDFLARSFRLFGLGKLSFPRKSFAEKNFHCGIFEDGDPLNDILHFRQDSLDSYFARLEKSIPKSKKMTTYLFSPSIKWYLLMRSKPYIASINQYSSSFSQYFTPLRPTKNPNRIRRPKSTYQNTRR